MTDMASQGALSKSELVSAFDMGVQKHGRDNVSEKTSTFVKILYYIGGAVVVIGLVVLIQQQWMQFDSLTRVVVTLGMGVGLYISAVLVGSSYKDVQGVSDAFHLVGALLIPTGIYVMLHEYFSGPGGPGVHSIVMGALFVAYLASYFTFRRTVLLIFTIIFGSLFYFAFLAYTVGEHIPFDPSRFFMYETLMLGSSYLFLGRSFAGTKRNALSGILYGFGSLGFLGSALALGGWSPDAYILWELVYPAIVFGFVSLSVYLQSKTFLVFGSIFLMAYIMKITAEYFAETTGWPLALMVVGFALIGIGYLTFYLNKRYISS